MYLSRHQHVRFAPLTLLLLIVLHGCSKPAQPDAYGNFEEDEVVVGTEVGGVLRQFDPREGAELLAMAAVAAVDTVPLALERNQLVAQRAGLQARSAESGSQLRALQVQRDVAARTRARIEQLFATQNATALQRDQVERDEKVLAAQLDAAREAIARSRADLVALEARVASAEDRLRRAIVHNPVAGTVLVTYVHAGEIVGPGQALYRIANLDTLTLRAYVTGGQLTAFALGSRVTVAVADTGAAQRTVPGTVSWVSSRAEFTPTPVQTREDRGDLVYAVKVRVANPGGRLKVGMPADVTLASRVAAAP